MRALFQGQIGNAVIWQAGIILVALSLVTVVLSSRLFSRSVA